MAFGLLRFSGLCRKRSRAIGLLARAVLTTSENRNLEGGFPLLNVVSLTGNEFLLL